MAESKSSSLLFGAAVAAAAVAVGVYFYKQRFSEAPPAPPSASANAPVVPNLAPPPIQHPLPQTGAADEPLPPLEHSDDAVHDALSSTFGDSLWRFVIPDNFVRNFVATVDNLPRAKLAARLNPIKAVPGQFAISGKEDEPVISPQNDARYAQLVQLFQSTDTQKLVDTYLKFYPLMQNAYEDLGYPDRYFNDRVVEVIDHLLATPAPAAPIALKQPKVLYEYADPQLESLSAGQKALLRLGANQAAAVKAKLRDVRAKIAKPSGQTN